MYENITFQVAHNEKSLLVWLLGRQIFHSFDGSQLSQKSPLSHMVCLGPVHRYFLPLNLIHFPSPG